MIPSLGKAFFQEPIIIHCSVKNNWKLANQPES